MSTAVMRRESQVALQRVVSRRGHLARGADRVAAKSMFGGLACSCQI